MEAAKDLEGKDPTDPEVRLPLAHAGLLAMAEQVVDSLAPRLPKAHANGEAISRDDLDAFVAVAFQGPDEQPSVLLADVEQGCVMNAFMLRMEEANALRGTLGKIAKGEPTLIVRPPSGTSDPTDPTVRAVKRMARPRPSGGDEPATAWVEANEGVMNVRHESGSIRTAILGGLTADVPMVLSARAFAQLAEETGSAVEAGEWLKRAAGVADKPIAIHGDDSTVFISPPDWTTEKLKGWVAGQREAIEKMFGPIDPDSIETYKND